MEQKNERIFRFNIISCNTENRELKHYSGVTIKTPTVEERKEKINKYYINVILLIIQTNLLTCSFLTSAFITVEPNHLLRRTKYWRPSTTYALYKTIRSCSGDELLPLPDFLSQILFRRSSPNPGCLCQEVTTCLEMDFKNVTAFKTRHSQCK